MDSFDIGKRIGQANRAPGHRHCNVEKWEAQRGAAAFAAADLARECRGEFLAGGVILHIRRIRFRISQHFARSIDDGGASPGGLRFLRNDVLERAGAVGFHAVGEQ